MNDSSTGYSERAILGPLDASEVRDLKPYHDFGAIRVPNRSDLEIRLEVEENTGTVIAVAIDIAQSNLQLQAFAAARGEGLWAEIRASLIASIKSQGGRVTEQFGSFGAELYREISNTPPTGLSRHLKFIGVDGPRWFLRAAISGAALTDPVAAGIVEDVIRGIVINRGDSPMPPRELLTITMPPGAAAAARS